MTRDSIVLWIGIISGLLGVIIAQVDVLPISPTVKTWLTMIGSILAVISGKLASSPLPGAPKPNP